MGEAVVEPAHECVKNRVVGDHLAKLAKLVADSLDAS